MGSRNMCMHCGYGIMVDMMWCREHAPKGHYEAADKRAGYPLIEVKRPSLPAVLDLEFLDQVTNFDRDPEEQTLFSVYVCHSNGD